MVRTRGAIFNPTPARYVPGTRTRTRYQVPGTLYVGRAFLRVRVHEHTTSIRTTQAQHDDTRTATAAAPRSRTIDGYRDHIYHDLVRCTWAPRVA